MELRLPHGGVVHSLADSLAELIRAFHDEHIVFIPVIHDGWDAVFVHLRWLLVIDFLSLGDLKIETEVGFKEALLKRIGRFQTKNSVTHCKLSRERKLEETSVTIMIVSEAKDKLDVKSTEDKEKIAVT